jgi:hypothetical protein
MWAEVSARTRANSGNALRVIRSDLPWFAPTTDVNAQVHIGAEDANRTMTGGHVSHVGQLFPSDAVNAEVYTLAPYNSETVAVVTHAEDRVWTHGPARRIA